MLNFISYCSTVIFLNKKNQSLLLTQLYNKTEFILGITRQKVEYYNSKLEVKPFENTQLMTSDDLMTLKIRKDNIKSIKQVEIELHSSCLLYTSPSPRDKRQSRMPSSA